MDMQLEALLASQGEMGSNRTSEQWWGTYFGASTGEMEGPQIQELEGYAAPRRAAPGEGVPLPAEALFAHWSFDRNRATEQRAKKWKSLAHIRAGGGKRRTGEAKSGNDGHIILQEHLTKLPEIEEERGSETWATPVGLRSRVASSSRTEEHSEQVAAETKKRGRRNPLRIRLVSNTKE